MTDQKNLEIRVRDLSNITSYNFVFVAFFLIATAFVHKIEASRTADSIFSNNVTASYLLSLFNLSSENTLASWFSSMLLLQAGMFALICYWLDRRFADRSILQYGWIFMAVFFFLLSLDELGSLHENAGAIGALDVAGTGGWESVVAIPLAVALLYMALFAFKHLRHHRFSLLLMVAGMGLLMTLPLHEYFEMQEWSKSGYSEEWRRPVFLVLLEEGSELFAFMLFIVAMKSFIVQKAGAEGTVAIRKIRVVAVVAGAGVLMFFSAVTLYFYSNLISADQGIALNWFPAALAFTSAFLIISTRRDLVYGLFFICVSAFFGTNFYALMGWNEISILRYIVGFCMIAGMIAWVLSRLLLESRVLNKFVIVISAAAIVSTLFIPSIEITFVVLIALAFLTSYLATASTDIKQSS